MAPTTFMRHLEKLKKSSNIALKPDTHWTVVTICKWEEYQDCESDNGQATRQATVQATDTDKNVKNDKELRVARKLEFESIIKSLNFDLPSSEIQNFIDYWTDINNGDSKMRFQYEKRFYHKRRLITWKANMKPTLFNQPVKSTTLDF
jgi:hypothetical protein